MRRIDRIFSALGDSNNNSNGNSNKGDESLTLPNAMNIACNEKLNEAGNGLNGYLVRAMACCDEQDNNNIDSPTAPLFSPLTPLIAKKKTEIVFENNQENSSPVRSMSPDTLELYQTLKGALENDVEFLDIINEKHTQEVSSFVPDLIEVLEVADNFAYRNDNQEVNVEAPNSREELDGNQGLENKNEEHAQEEKKNDVKLVCSNKEQIQEVNDEARNLREILDDNQGWKNQYEKQAQEENEVDVEFVNRNEERIQEVNVEDSNSREALGDNNGLMNTNKEHAQEENEVDVEFVNRNEERIQEVNVEDSNSREALGDNNGLMNTNKEHAQEENEVDVEFVNRNEERIQEVNVEDSNSREALGDNNGLMNTNKEHAQEENEVDVEFVNRNEERIQEVNVEDSNSREALGDNNGLMNTNKEHAQVENEFDVEFVYRNEERIQEVNAKDSNSREALGDNNGLKNTNKEHAQVENEVDVEFVYRNEEHIQEVNDEAPREVVEENHGLGNTIEENDHAAVLDINDATVVAGRPKKGRKRKYLYKLAEAKERKYANLSYRVKKKYVEPKVFRDYICNCNKLCHLLVSKEDRQDEFQKYVVLGSYEAQLLYILNCVTEKPKARVYTIVNGIRPATKKPREYVRKYTICDIEVCRDMFINNFQISPKKIDVCLKKKRAGKTLNDKRGQSSGGRNKTKEEDLDFVKNIINSIPKYESHYRREQNNGVQYLKNGMTVTKVYDLYLEKFKETYGESRNPISLATLRRIFTTHFNLRCKTLKKDTCSRYDTFTNKIQNSTPDDEQLDKLKEDKEKHLKRAEDLRNCMNNDLMRAKTDESFECLTFDLEKTLPLPRIPTSIVFYKRQLWLYNCGIHAGSNDCGHCYVWIEGEAGRGAQEVGSCLIKHIKNKLNPKVEHLALWSDCCGGQNRNIKIVLMLKVALQSHQSLKTITLNYLESGHTFLPNDTDFSKIETQLKFCDRIYTADEYMNVIKTCKRKNPLQVYKMQKEDFLGSINLEKKIVNRKIFVDKTKTNWLQTKQILLKKDQEYTIFMKTNILEDQYQELNIEKRQRGKSFVLTENDFSVLWPNGKEIPQAKLNDLKSMFDLIPKDCLEFYKSLKGNSDLMDDLEGYGGPPDFDIETDAE